MSTRCSRCDSDDWADWKWDCDLALYVRACNYCGRHDAKSYEDKKLLEEIRRQVKR